MPRISVVTTGGTIASTRDERGVSTPVVAGSEVLQAAAAHADLRVVEVMSKDSSSLTFADMDAIREAVQSQLADPDLDAVVVLHGTDTMEETAFLVDLHHEDPRPVVFTGAQRTFDHPDSDAAANLLAAITAVTDRAYHRSGVSIAFGGKVHYVPGTRKIDTSALDAFGSVVPGEEPQRCAKTLPWHPTADVRVDIVAVYPGADRVQIDACAAAGTHGLVIEGLGSGNANPDVVRAVRDCVDADIPVVVTTRVPWGPTSPGYGGGGGGDDLIQAGALFSTDLRAGQARVLLASLLADPGLDRLALRRTFESLSRIRTDSDCQPKLNGSGVLRN